MTSPCDTCGDPGHCCRVITLNHYFPTTITIGGVLEFLQTHGLPFEPIEPWLSEDYSDEVNSHGWPAPKEGKDLWKLSCPLLTAEGRCGDYENRPHACRAYEPKSTALCFHFEEPTT